MNKSSETQSTANQYNTKASFQNFDQLFAQFPGNRQQASTSKNPIERDELIKNIKIALDLEIAVDSCTSSLSRLRSMQYRDTPVVPTKPQKEYVPDSIYSSMTMDDYINAFVGMFSQNNNSSKRKEEQEKQLATKRASAEARYAQQVAEYEQEVKDYYSVVLPQYQKEKAAWEDQHKIDIANMEKQQQQYRRDLAAHYEATKVVPMQYRKTDALRYIYDVMRSSNYTLAQSIENYEQAVRRQIEQERLRVQQATYEEQRRAADAEERAAWAAEDAAASAKRAERNSAQSERKTDYYWSSNCQQRINARNGKVKLFHACQGCRMAQFCSHYR